jgi:hypothetical protein
MTSDAHKNAVCVWRRVRIPLSKPCEQWKATKREPGGRGYKWATLSLGDLVLQVGGGVGGGGRKADDLEL